MTTTILLPTLNEEKSIGETIKEIKTEYSPECKIVVIDGLSKDKTVELALGLGAIVINVYRKGKGVAVKDALSILRASAIRSDYYVMMDSDFTYPASYIRQITDELKNGADVVMGYRKYKADGAMSRANMVGNRALSALASILYGFSVKDVCTGLWGFRGGVLDRFRLTSTGFTLEADLFGNAMKTGCKIVQIPIYYRARLEGSVTKLQIRHGFEIGWFLIKNRWKK